MRYLFLLVLLTFLISGSVVHAGPRATPDEAKAMAEKAAALLNSDGIEKAKEQFLDKNGSFFDRELYVVVMDRHDHVVTHGTMPHLAGQDHANLRDPNGKAFGHDISSIEGEGWIEYMWQNPVTKKTEKKQTYAIHVGDYVVAVGTFVE